MRDVYSFVTAIFITGAQIHGVWLFVTGLFVTAFVPGPRVHLPFSFGGGFFITMSRHVLSSVYFNGGLPGCQVGLPGCV